MLTINEINEIVDSLTTRQADRLMKSHANVTAFLARPEEKAVSFEIDCYNSMLAEMEKQPA